MNQKDDIYFMNAYQNAESREILLRQLIKQRKHAGIGLLFVLPVLIVLMILLFFTKDDSPAIGSIMLVTMINFGIFVHSDLKIKILLTQNQTRPIE